ncbi:uncharacterized protein LOC143253732 [Tachypleus tridentatus]|uniref:uncharacterized protein LOC143253732 n=1 Tax=Tachypleus tridentatus TaxID=6853 RepID=UPI003FD429A1
MADNKKRMTGKKPKTLNDAQESCKVKGESSAITTIMCDEQETSVPPEVYIPKSDFAVPRKPLWKRIWNGLKNVFSCHHVYKPFEEERRRGTKDPYDEEESSWCHDSCNNTEQGEMESLPLSDCACGRVIGIDSNDTRVVSVLKPRHTPNGFFVTKWRLKNCKGSEVFMSRIKDHETFISLRGIHDPGDEILKINNVSVTDENFGRIKNLTITTKNIRFTAVCLSNPKDN